MVANLCYQLSWQYLITLLYSPTDIVSVSLETYPLSTILSSLVYAVLPVAVTQSLIPPPAVHQHCHQWNNHTSAPEECAS